MPTILFSDRAASRSLTTLAGLGVSNPESLLPDPLGAFVRSSLFAFGIHKLNPLWAGACLRVKVGSTETDIGFNVSGTLDTASLATAAGAGDAVVVKWYDQSGNGLHAVPPAGLEPQLVVGGTILVNPTNGLPAIQTLAGVSAMRCLTIPVDLASPVAYFSAFSAFRKVTGTAFNAWGNQTTSIFGFAGPSLYAGVFQDGIDDQHTGNFGDSAGDNIDLLSYVPSAITRYVNGAAGGTSPARTYGTHGSEFVIGGAFRSLALSFVSTLKHQAFVVSVQAMTATARAAYFAALNAKLGYY
jgi:hypothetical protein